LSFHFAQLERAGLVSSRRDSRNVNYAVDYKGMRDLLDFLTEDCCNNEPELCGNLAAVSKCDASMGELNDEWNEDIQCLVSMHGQFGEINYGRMHHQQGGRSSLRRLFGGK
jgi:hypothetical protein